MKTHLIALSIIFVTAFSSCISNQTLSVAKPAAVDLPKEIKKVVIVNNTLLANKKQGNIAEAILSGEQIKGDAVASQEASKGMVSSFNREGLYTSTTLESVAYTNKDKSINWSKVEETCKKEGADLVISMDMFDTNSPVGGVILGNALGAGGGTLDGVAYYSLYYPAEKKIIDNLEVRDIYDVPASGSPTLLATIADATVKRDYTKQLGYDLGYKAGDMLQPNWINVNRKFYGNGHDGLKQVKRMIRTSSWEMADQKLSALMKNSDEKVRMKATFNRALTKEGLGDLEGALELAKQAATEYDCKHAYPYINVLNSRIADVQQIEFQLAN